MDRSNRNSVWNRFLKWVQQVGEAMAYEPIDDLESRVVRLENEIRTLRAR